MAKKKLTTTRERARALAQECVLFGRLNGSQWDGLTAILVMFAEAESAAALENAAITARELGDGRSTGHEISDWLRWRAKAIRTRHGAIEDPQALGSSDADDAVARSVDDQHEPSTRA